MRVAMMGTRGIPASYSGFETLLEELGARLVQRGHDVTVYGRTHHIRYRGEEYRGMRLVLLPTVRNKYLDTLVHTFLSTLHGAPRHYDVVLMCIAGNSPVAWIPRVGGTRVVLHVNGHDWKRDKWPRLARYYLQLSEWLGTWTANELLTDAVQVQKYYRSRYRRDIPCIGYGAAVIRRPPGPYLERFGLEPRRYALFVGRLVPENCAHDLVAAFEGLDTTLKCVIVGDAPYSGAYIRSLKQTRDPRIVFTGYLFGEGYQELSSNAYLFVEPSEVGGTHPALVEALGYGNCVVVNGIPENLSTIGDAGFAYDGRLGAEGLRPVLRRLLSEPDLVGRHRDMAARRAREHYSWDAVTDQYEALFERLRSRRRPGC